MHSELKTCRHDYPSTWCPGGSHFGSSQRGFQWLLSGSSRSQITEWRGCCTDASEYWGKSIRVEPWEEREAWAVSLGTHDWLSDLGNVCECMLMTHDRLAELKSNDGRKLEDSLAKINPMKIIWLAWLWLRPLCPYRKINDCVHALIVSLLSKFQQFYCWAASAEPGFTYWHLVYRQSVSRWTPHWKHLVSQNAALTRDDCTAVCISAVYVTRLPFMSLL